LHHSNENGFPATIHLTQEKMAEKTTTGKQKLLEMLEMFSDYTTETVRHRFLN
jgi:hypothetical protein